MRELSLFTGAGGGLLGTHLLGWTPVGYVENDDYCQRVLRARINDGLIPEAPIFGDIRAFLSEGYADSYQGMVDVVTAGFPCTPYSVAGKGLGQDDERNLWPETRDTIRAVGPRYVLLENVPGLLAHKYFGTILGDLAESGYDVRWDCVSAGAVGAPHRRDRLWVYGNSNKHSKSTVPIHAEASELSSMGAELRGAVADAGSRRGQEDELRAGRDEPGVRGSELADADQEGLQGRTSPEVSRREAATGHSGKSGWWLSEPNVGRVAYGVASRVDRLRAIGNGQVPRVVQTAWEVLSE